MKEPIVHRLRGGIVLMLGLAFVVLGLACLVVSPATAGTAEDVRAPTYPKPPTEADCRTYQTAMDEFHRDAQAEMRQCSAMGRACPIPAGRLSYASGRVGYVAACFTAAHQKSNEHQVIEFLRRDKYPDIASFGSAAKSLKETRDEALALYDLKDRISNYSNLSDSDKLDTNKEIASRLNVQINQHELSQTLTENALTHITEKHRDALTRLDIKLKSVTDQHREMLARGAAFANISRRSALQAARSRDAETINRAERQALAVERRNRDATNAAILAQEEVRRQNEYRARMEAIAEKHQAEIQEQADAQQMFNNFTSMMGAAIANSGRNNGYAPYGYGGSGAPIQTPSPRVPSGSSRPTCNGPGCAWR